VAESWLSGVNGTTESKLSGVVDTAESKLSSVIVIVTAITGFVGGGVGEMK
jgi:hypothetical protein